MAFAFLMLVLTLGLFTINSSALTLYTLETSVINDFDLLSYGRDKVLALEPSATNITLIKIVTPNSVVYRIRYVSPDGLGYGGTRQRVYNVNKDGYCRDTYGVFAWSDLDKCKYFIEYSNTTLTVTTTGNFRVTRLSSDRVVDGSFRFGNRVLTNSFNNNFSSPISLGNITAGTTIVLSTRTSFKGVNYVNASNDSTRSLVSVCGTNCWIVAFENTNNGDMDDLIVRVERV
jgi:hypothetical protein